MSFVEFYKNKIAERKFNFEGDEGKKLSKDLKGLGFIENRYKGSIIEWANLSLYKNKGLFLKTSNDYSLLPPWQTYDYKNIQINKEKKDFSHSRDAVVDAVEIINSKLKDSKFLN